MNSVPTSAAAVALFYGYAHEDEALRYELHIRLTRVDHRRLPVPWHDCQAVAGQDWAGRRKENLRRAALVLPLVSQNFIESDSILGAELAVAIRHQAEPETLVMPIVVRAVDLECPPSTAFIVALPSVALPSPGFNKNVRSTPW